MQEKRRLHKLDTFCSKAEVVDATNAFLWPTYYTIYNKHYGLVKVECYDPVYMNQAVKGEQVYIKAPMYIDLDTDCLLYTSYRRASFTVSMKCLEFL